MSNRKGTASGSKKRPHREILVVQCPNDNPFATGSPSLEQKDEHRQNRRANNNNGPNNKVPTKQHSKLLNWKETTQEIRILGASSFVGNKKRDYEEEQYERLTGRKKKRQKIPLPIVRGMKKKAAKQHAKLLQEARESGLAVTTTTLKKQQSKKKPRDRTSDIYGPAPSIGFVKKGVLHLKSKPN